MNPHFVSRIVSDRQRELERMASATAPRRGRRWSIFRPIGLALMRAGRRLAGPDEPMDRRSRALMLTDNGRS